MRMACFFFAGLAALATSPSVQAQYEWLDHNGRHVFSDQMPPSDIPQERILKQPDASHRAPARTVQMQDDVAVDAQEADATGAPPAVANLAPDAPQQAEASAGAEEQAARKEAEARQQAMRADNCERARQAKRTLESGMRIARVNEAGERVIMDDAQRAAELKRANEVIGTAC